MELRLCTYCTPTNHFQTTRAVLIGLFHAPHQGWGRVSGVEASLQECCPYSWVVKTPDTGYDHNLSKGITLQLIFKVFLLAAGLRTAHFFQPFHFQPALSKAFVTTLAALCSAQSVQSAPPLNTVWTSATHLVSRRLSFLLCKMGEMVSDSIGLS